MADTPTPIRPNGDHEEALALRRRAQAKLRRVLDRTPEDEARTRRMSRWGEENGFAPLIHNALRGDQ